MPVVPFQVVMGLVPILPLLHHHSVHQLTGYYREEQNRLYASSFE